MQLFIFVTFGVCIVSVITKDDVKERVASLVVLPPLVLGYDELYHDSPENKKPVRQREAPVEYVQPTAETTPREWVKPTVRGKPIEKVKPVERPKPVINPKPTEKAKGAGMELVTVEMVNPEDVVKPVPLVKTADLLRMAAEARVKPMARSLADLRAAKIKVLKRMPLDRLVIYDDNAVDGEEAVVIPQQRIVLRRNQETRRAFEEAKKRIKNFYLDSPSQAKTEEERTLIENAEETAGDETVLAKESSLPKMDSSAQEENTAMKSIDSAEEEERQLVQKILLKTDVRRANGDDKNLTSDVDLVSKADHNIQFHGEFALPDGQVTCSCGRKH